MKIYIGTLYSGENEYDECLASIDSQTYTDFNLFIFEHLPKLEAHRQLYRSFLDQKDQYDLLIKIDADMVLTRDTIFEEIVSKFLQNEWLDVFTIGITDFFSGQMINGLNSYRNTVEWALDPHNVNADVVIADPEGCYYDKTDLAPAAVHCKNPSPLQAIHYGVHRGLKSIARKHSTTHWALLEKTWQNFFLTRDVRIGLAILGAELVYAGEFSRDDIDYTNSKVKNTLKKYLPLDASGVEKEIKKMRLRNWGFLPGDLRRPLLRKKWKAIIL